MPVATPFVGRNAELEVLDELLDLLDQGKPRAAEIVGPAGMGKTRLLAELAGKADERGHVVLTGAAAELEQDLPFWVFVDALDEYVEGVEPRRLERLDDVVRTELGHVLPCLATADPAVTPGLHERYRTHRAIRELLEQLAATKPLVLILDDFHWADQASVDLLVALLHRPPAAGVLIAIASRPRHLPARLATALDRAHRDRTLSRLELQELTRDEAQSLLGRSAAALYEESGGNPFFLEQLARLPDAEAGARASDGVALGGVTVPPLVAAALTEELTLLSAPARRVLDGASVAGDPFEIDLAAAACNMSEPEVLEAIDELVRVEFVRDTDIPRRFGFRHPIVRRAVYEATPRGWRVGAHERVATALAARGTAATTRAHHVERSARHGDRAAIATLRDAAAESSTRAPATSARWLEATLRLLPDDAPAAERIEILLGMARAMIATGRFEEGRNRLLQALEILPTDAGMLRTQVATMLARVEHLLGLHEQAHARLLDALEELPGEACEHCVALMIELTMDGMHRMNYAAMHEWGERAAEAAERVEDEALRAAALAAAARGAAFKGRNEDSMRRHDEAAAVIDALPDGVLARRLDALASLAGTELYMHMWAEAYAHAERAITIGRATGQGQQFPLLYAILGQTRLMQGRSNEMVDMLDAAIEAARLTGNAQTLTWSLYPRAMAALVLGDLPTALSAAQEAVDVIADGKPSHHFAHAAFALAQAHLEMGKPDRAVELLERSAGGPDMPLAARSFRALFLEPYVLARLALGDRETAERAVGWARACAEAAGLPTEHAWADRAEAAVALDAGNAAQAAELALSAAEVQEATGMVVEAARSRALAGRALARAGDRERAREMLERAAEVFMERGAERYRQAAERELRQLGHRVHRRSQAAAATSGGVGSLTSRELEVARAIVDRKTNRQIAEDLFLSPKTVETHIRNIFAKLGAGSRVEVAHIVEQAERLAASS
jgi:ATP/maltotriose-dependent transcriptional regulator MalT